MPQADEFQAPDDEPLLPPVRAGAGVIAGRGAVTAPRETDVTVVVRAAELPFTAFAGITPGCPASFTCFMEFTAEAAATPLGALLEFTKRCSVGS
jgi:hypothetical protein